MSTRSTIQKAISKTGALVAPGSANTLKLDYTTAPGTSGAKGVAKLVTTLSNKQTVEDPYSAGEFENMTVDSNITVPEIMKALALYPSGDKDNHGDYLYMRNMGERLPFRGGSFSYTSSAGVFALYLNIPRANSSIHIGFRSAFIEIQQFAVCVLYCHDSGIIPSGAFSHDGIFFIYLLLLLQYVRITFRE